MKSRGHKSRDGQQKQSSVNIDGHNHQCGPGVAPADVTVNEAAAKSMVTGSTDVIAGNPGADEASPTGKISVVEMAVAGVLLSAGTVALIVSVIVGGTVGRDGDQAWTVVTRRDGDPAWTVVGSSLMGLGSLLMVVGICWSLAKSSSVSGTDQRTTGVLREVRVNANQLESFVHRGFQVQYYRTSTTT